VKQLRAAGAEKVFRETASARGLTALGSPIAGFAWKKLIGMPWKTCPSALVNGHIGHHQRDLVLLLAGIPAP